MMLWRELLVSSVVHYKDSINVGFEDSSIRFQLGKKYLRQCGIYWKHIAEGRRILIKGRKGNEDAHLMRLNALEEIVLIPEKK